MHRSSSLYNLGVEIEENSELDLFEAFNKHDGDERIPAIVKEMEEELGAGNKKPEILPKLAQYELTLERLGRGAQRIPKICSNRRKMLAGIPDTVRICSMLCKQPSDSTGNSGIL